MKNNPSLVLQHKLILVFLKLWLHTKKTNTNRKKYGKLKSQSKGVDSLNT